MKAKALIGYDIGYGQEALKDLTNTLVKNDIDPFVFTDVSKLNEIIKSFDENQPLLYFKNQLIRITDLSSVKAWLFENKKFTGLRLKNLNASERRETQEVLAFYPKSLKEVNRGLIYLKDYFFDSSNIFFKIDLKEEKPIIFICTFDRTSYFKLTLDSLKHSLLNSIEKPKIVILLNDRNKESADISLKFKQNYENVDILSVFPNSYVSAVPLALQIYKTNKFISLEDDFILANCSNILYSSWAHLFLKKLDYFDFVGWSSDFLNYPYPIGPNIEEHLDIPNKLNNGILWVNFNHSLMKIRLGGQCIAINTNFYKDVLKTYDRTVIDTDMFKYAFKGLSTPTLLGYHIGWNQEQNGFSKLADKRFPDDYGFNGEYFIENLITKEKFNKLCPRDLIK